MILDGIIIILFLVTLIIGFKIGFIKSIIKLASSLCGLIFALIFFGSLANLLIQWGWQEPIAENIYNNVLESETLQDINTNSEEALTNLMDELGLPDFISNILTTALSDKINSEDIAITISEIISEFAINVIAFLMLLFGTTILFFLLKLMASMLRTSSLFKLIDGILGIGWASIIYVVALYIAFFLLALILQISSINDAIGPFLTSQMHLEEETYSIAKYFYEDNVITNILKLIF
ncbi:MAG: CvpA family protein [Erysipelotrichaceae bacterium]